MKHGPTQRIAGIRGPVRETAGGENTNEQKALGGTNYGLLSSPWYGFSWRLLTRGLTLAALRNDDKELQIVLAWKQWKGRWNTDQSWGLPVVYADQHMAAGGKWKEFIRPVMDCWIWKGCTIGSFLGQPRMAPACVSSLESSSWWKVGMERRRGCGAGNSIWPWGAGANDLTADVQDGHWWTVMTVRVDDGWWCASPTLDGWSAVTAKAGRATAGTMNEGGDSRRKERTVHHRQHASCWKEQMVAPSLSGESFSLR